MSYDYPDFFTPFRASDYPYPSAENTLWLNTGTIGGNGTVALYGGVLDSSWDCFLRRMVVYLGGSSEMFLKRGEGIELWFQLPSGYILRKTLSRPQLPPVGSGTEWRAGNVFPLWDVKVPAGDSLSIMLRTHDLVTVDDIVVIVSYIKEQSVT